VLAVNTSVFDRQRAERFAQLLDEASGARRHHVRSRADDDLTDLVDVGHRLGRIELGVQADPEFRDGLRAMLMATIEREGIGATATAPEPVSEPDGARHRQAGAGVALAWLPVRSRRARGAVVVGLAVGTLAVSGISAASGDAIPGDPLYGMKRSTERAQLAFASSQVGRGQLFLEFAKTRMNEAAAVRGDAPGLSGVLDDMDNETRQGVKLLTTAAVDRRDPAPLDAIDAFVTEQQRTMGGMLGAVTGAARNRTVGSLQQLDAIKKRVSGLRGSLSCGDLESMTEDELGPQPRQCVAQGPVQRPNGGGTNGAPAGNGATATGTAAAEAGSTTPTAGTPTPARAGSSAAPALLPGLSVTTKTPEDHKKKSDEGILDKIGRLLGG
jgi:hypothetical protein